MEDISVYSITLALVHDCTERLRSVPTSYSVLVEVNQFSESRYQLRLLLILLNSTLDFTSRTERETLALYMPYSLVCKYEGDPAGHLFNPLIANISDQTVTRLLTGICGCEEKTRVTCTYSSQLEQQYDYS